MPGNVTNNLPHSPFSLAALAFSISVNATYCARFQKPNKALKSFASLTGTAFRSPLA